MERLDNWFKPSMYADMEVVMTKDWVIMCACLYQCQETEINGKHWDRGTGRFCAASSQRSNEQLWETGECQSGTIIETTDANIILAAHTGVPYAPMCREIGTDPPRTVKPAQLESPEREIATHHQFDDAAHLNRSTNWYPVFWSRLLTTQPLELDVDDIVRRWSVGIKYDAIESLIP